MLKSLFKKKTTNTSIIAPLTGKVVLLDEVPDQVFSQKMMGDGIAIIPSANTLVSPVDGEIVNVFPTKHAITIRSKSGVELLIHMGLDTVNLKGEGFKVMVNDGDKIAVGDPIAEFDIDKVSSSGLNTITPIIVVNSEVYKIEDRKQDELVSAGKDLIMEITKI